MRTIVVSLLVMVAFASFVSADDFTLKNTGGETFGPFRFQVGTSIRLDDANYRISSITNTAEQRLLRKLETIIIPEINFKATPMEEVVDLLHKAARQYDPTGEGVHIAFTPSPWGFATNMCADEESNITATVTMAARHIPLSEALKLSSGVSGFRCVVRHNTVLILHNDAPDGVLVRRFYDVPPSFLQRVPDYRVDLKQTFAGFGIPWPKGSWIQNIPAIGKLIVVNTEDNLAIFEKIMTVLNVVPCQIKLEFFFVAFPTGMVSRTESVRHFTSDDALELWKEGKGRAVSTLLIITKSASEATSKTVTEMIYPTEFSFEPSGQGSNPPPAITGGAVTPGGFETRDVGFIVSVMPEVTPDGQMIDLTMTPQFIEDPAWEDYSAVLAMSNMSPTNVSCRQPIFSAHSLITQISVYRGTTVVVGGGWPLHRTPEVMYLIMKTDIVDPNGKVITPPDLTEILPESL